MRLLSLLEDECKSGAIWYFFPAIASEMRPPFFVQGHAVSPGNREIIDLDLPRLNSHPHLFVDEIVRHCSHGVNLDTGAIHRTSLPQICAT